MNSKILFFIGFVFLLMMLIISYWETISLIIKAKKKFVLHMPEKQAIELIKRSKKQAKAFDEEVRKIFGIKDEPVDIDDLFKRTINEEFNNKNGLKIALNAILEGELKDIVDLEINRDGYQLLLNKIDNIEFSMDNIDEVIALLLKELEGLKKVKR